MNKIKNYILGIDKKKLYLIQVLFILIMIATNYTTKQKFESGYQFFISFLSIVIVDLFIVVTTCRTIFELEGPPKNPFHLMKYPAYVMVVIFSLAPLLYLWSMRELITQLKW